MQFTTPLENLWSALFNKRMYYSGGIVDEQSYTKPAGSRYDSETTRQAFVIDCSEYGINFDLFDLHLLLW
ncbi:hypothetical protein T4E_2232 [Trichinella pseudospiralis]|uniref:Uncharacterized protein n=1 Tax=Trichinella pseudospiralis TaxID=6337 RepID=A0A0V0YHX9_TRIPS|nr:hypothetical protein T4E_2232 [Trichinella pseudospiralis]